MLGISFYKKKMFLEDGKKWRKIRFQNGFKQKLVEYKTPFTVRKRGEKKENCHEKNQH